jgi:FkbM family methyltransferase
MPAFPRAPARTLRNLARPHYVFRPRQIVRRVVGELRPRSTEHRFRLEWGSEITANPRDSIGKALLRRGILDLVVCETLLRLTDPGETVVDAGANIGQMTSLLAHAVGEHGRVFAFEPHPEVFAVLARNAAEWHALPGSAPIELNQAGVSDTDGTATLSTDVFDINKGSPSLEPTTQQRGTLDAHRVRVTRLDTALAARDVGVMKIDIEGHEIRALDGARASLAAGRIRDIVFEERDTPPTPVTRFLSGNGYSIMRLGEGLRGPMLGPLGATNIISKDDPSLLATLDPRRATERMRVRGWAIYGLGPAGRVERARRPR